MKWVLRILGVLFLLVVAVFAIGAALPREHIATVRARYAAPPDSVFSAIADVAHSASWRSDIDSVALLTHDEPLRWREVGEYGAITYLRENLEPPLTLAARIDDPGQPFGGTWTWRIEPNGDGTLLTITEEGWVDNPVFRFLARFVFGHHATMESYARDLGARFGSDIEIERSR